MNCELRSYLPIFSASTNPQNSTHNPLISVQKDLSQLFHHDELALPCNDHQDAAKVVTPLDTYHREYTPRKAKTYNPGKNI
jgi:hypothetical protein